MDGRDSLFRQRPEQLKVIVEKVISLSGVFDVGVDEVGFGVDARDCLDSVKKVGSSGVFDVGIDEEGVDSEWMFDARVCFNGIKKVVVGQEVLVRRKEVSKWPRDYFDSVEKAVA